MKYVKALKYDKYKNKFMGPNPIKLLEELMCSNKTPTSSVVMDLGSGQGITSVFLAREYGFKIYAADLWSDPYEISEFLKDQGITKEQIIPVHADANNLPFEKNYFDAVVSIDSYHYFARNIEFLDKKLLPFVKKGGYIYIAIPGMKKDCHDNIPEELLLSWSSKELDYFHDVSYWTNLINHSKYAEIISISQMDSFDEVWKDWLVLDNEYAKGDRKTMEAGGGRYLNFISIILKKI